MRSWIVVVVVLASVASTSAAEPAGAVAVKIEGDFRAIRSDYPLPLPFAIRSQEDASKLFEGETLRNLLAKIDFATHYALVFAWNGSSYDELTVADDPSNHLGVSFLLEKAMTADFAQHVEIYALRSNVRYGFSKSLEDEFVGKSRLTTDSPWTPDGSGVEPEPEPDRVVYRILRDGHGGRFVPNGGLELRTKTEALRYFNESDLAEVDFRKQYVLALSWGGSGQDEIRASFDEADPKEIVFEIAEGFTDDDFPHFRAYAIQSGATWAVTNATPAPPTTPPAVEALGRVMISGPAFDRYGRLVPVEVRTREEAAKYFTGDALRTIDGKVDFEREYVIIFAWVASSYDRLTYAESRSDASNAVFVYQKAMTCDCADNVQVYSLPVEMQWRMDEPKR